MKKLLQKLELFEGRRVFFGAEAYRPVEPSGPQINVKEVEVPSRQIAGPKASMVAIVDTAVSFAEADAELAAEVSGAIEALSGYLNEFHKITGLDSSLVGPARLNSLNAMGQSLARNFGIIPPKMDLYGGPKEKVISFTDEQGEKINFNFQNTALLRDTLSNHLSKRRERMVASTDSPFS